EVAHQATERQRPRAHQRWRGDDLLAPGSGRILIEVDDVEIVSAQQMLLAERARVRDRPGRARAHAGDEQPEDVAFGARWAMRPSRRHRRHAVSAAGWTSSPTSTRSAFERSPMIRFTGGGSRRTSVGMTTISSPR